MNTLYLALMATFLKVRELEFRVGSQLACGDIVWTS